MPSADETSNGAWLIRMFRWNEKTYRGIASAGVTVCYGLSLLQLWSGPHRINGGLAAVAAVITGIGIGYGWRTRPCVVSEPPIASLESDREPEEQCTISPADEDFSAPAADPGPLPEDPSQKISKVAECCVRLFDELDKNMEDFDQGKRELAEHVMARIEVILESAGVEAIEGEVAFDRMRHEPDKSTANGAEIAETISPGFSLGQRVLRRARVRIA